MGGGHFCPPQNSGDIGDDLGLRARRLLAHTAGDIGPIYKIQTGPIYKIQTMFDRSGKFVKENLLSWTSGSPMTSQVRSKSKCLMIWHIWIFLALRSYKMEKR